VAAAAVMRASPRATRLTSAPAPALTGLPHKIRDSDEVHRSGVEGESCNPSGD